MKTSEATMVKEEPNKGSVELGRTNYYCFPLTSLSSAYEDLGH